MTLRFLAFFMLFFLLLEPLIKTETIREEKPIVVIVADNSLSIKTNKDSVELLKKIPLVINSLKEKVSEKFETYDYRFGEKLNEGTDTLLLNEKITDISSAFDEISSRYYNRNLGAVILLSDGIYNKGKNPLTKSREFKNVSFYTIGLGDTLVNSDVLVADMLYNKTAYLGNDYPVEVIVNAKKLSGKRTEIILRDNGVEVGRREMSIQTPNQVLRFSFLINAKVEGQRKISAEIKSVEGEFTDKNNTMTVYVNVVKNRQKILILAYAPHADVNAMKYALESSQNYKVTSKVYTQGADYNLADYNLVIMHQLPTSVNDEEIIRKVKNAGVPVLYLIGANSNLTLLTKNAGVLAITTAGKTSNNCQPILNQSFTGFNLSDKTKALLGKLPPLQCPFGTYNLAPGANVLMFQKIGAVKSENPLILFNKESGYNKTGIICGEGIWTWKMKDFDVNENNEAFNEIIQKCVQYLSVVENRSYFKVNHKNEYGENEPVLIDAELFNENYEPVNEPDVTIDIFNTDKKRFDRTFSRVGKAYRLNAGMLPSGEYTYIAKTSYGKRNLEKTGKFIVTTVNNELLRTEADHRLLFTMAKESGGKFYAFENTSSLPDDLMKNENMSTTSYLEKRLDDLINFRWLIILPIFLLALEWFLRKRAGSY